ncbi:unnamed protein product [Ectocarpus sp. 6 AP-2014]
MATAAFHVPSVPRSLLLPGLDTHQVQEEDDVPTDPTPPGSHWLFRPPPFIAHADLEAETVTIRNPSVWTGANLAGYTLTDRLQRHTYHFPERFVLRARTSLTLYCCPGKFSEGALHNLPQPFLLWHNQDGSLRRKEVMENSGETLVLSDAKGNEVAVLEVPGTDGEETSRTLPGVKRSQVLALRTLVLSLCYLRLVCTGLAAARVTVHPDVFLLFTALAHVFDILSRWASSRPGVPMDDFGVVLATMGDRFSYLVLLGSLVLLDKDPRHSQMFGGMLALDMTANWLQLSVASISHGSHPLAGTLVSGRGAAPDFATHIMLTHPVELTLVSLGSEAFLVWSYLVASSDLPLGLRAMVAKAGDFLSSLFTELLSSFSPSSSSSSSFLSSDIADEEVASILISGEETMTAAEDGGVFGGFEPNRIDSAALGLGEDLGVGEAEDDGDGSPFSTAWKAVWMTLMVCCAARQLLSCIQALISMSSLSSGVIADAAGKEMQRRHPRSRRSSGGGGSSRGRSRSRAR